MTGTFDPNQSFEVKLARTQRSLTISTDSNILDELLLEGIEVGFSCMSGMCGSCRVSVLEGVPDHRDEVLTQEERSQGDCIILCCSRSRTPVLVLDL
jgi:vanillate O-demethylase ferredoxin subunit